VLVAHRSLFRSSRPERPGGGTVDYVGGVDRSQIDYTVRLDEREEGGTPSIIGDLRAGVAFLLKEMLDPRLILEHELELARHAIERLRKNSRITVYGPTSEPRLAILSFNVAGLHHDFVSTLLDQLFGIQNRAGCSCAGPYGHRLLGIEAEKSALYRARIAAGQLGVKPGWVRVSIPFYASAREVEFVLRAIEFVADRGELFLPLYRLGWQDGTWRHIEHPVGDFQPIELTPEALREACKRSPGQTPDPPPSPTDLDREREQYLVVAEQLAKELEARYLKDPPNYRTAIGNPEIDPLIWFRFVHSQ
jgi:hypothetical protein